MVGAPRKMPVLARGLVHLKAGCKDNNLYISKNFILSLTSETRTLHAWTWTTWTWRSHLQREGLEICLHPLGGMGERVVKSKVISKKCECQCSPASWNKNRWWPERSCIPARSILLQELLDYFQTKFNRNQGHESKQSAKLETIQLTCIDDHKSASCLHWNTPPLKMKNNQIRFSTK